MAENLCYMCISVNCIDRHLATRSDKVALIWEKDEPGQQEYVTYKLVSSYHAYCRSFGTMIRNVPFMLSKM